jgi:hypothetical protein
MLPNNEPPLGGARKKSAGNSERLKYDRNQIARFNNSQNETKKGLLGIIEKIAK